MAAEPLAKKSFIIECLGELVDREEAKDPLPRPGTATSWPCRPSLSGRRDEDGLRGALREALERAELRDRDVGRAASTRGYGLFALREIGENEELTL